MFDEPEKKPTPAQQWQKVRELMAACERDCLIVMGERGKPDWPEVLDRKLAAFAEIEVMIHIEDGKPKWWEPGER